MARRAAEQTARDLEERHAEKRHFEERRSMPEIESTLDLHRHRHDGTQPTREKATPSHRADIEWTIKH